MKAAGITYMTLRDWIRRGILPPPLEAVTGRGNVARHDSCAVLRAELARRLRDEGWTLGGIAEHMKSLEWNVSDAQPEDAEFAESKLQQAVAGEGRPDSGKSGLDSE